MKSKVLALAAVLALTSFARADYIHPYAYPQPDEGNEFLTVIEIPAGSITKYEIAKEGYVLVDRYMSMPVAYPANYGSIPSSLGGDGDPLDGLVFSREPIVPGAVIKVRAIGVLHMIDGGEEDSKIIAVPASDVDPTYDEIRSLDDLPAIERERIEGFFRVYKHLPQGSKVIELKGMGGVNEAQSMVADALKAYREKAK